MTLFALAAALLAAAPGPVFSEKPCLYERILKFARCGTVVVPEDRQRPRQRTIALNVIVMPATSPTPHAPPLFDIDGGPGLPVTKNAEFYASFGSTYRARRDVVMVDQRGTGGSNPLHCSELSAPQAAYQPLYPAAAVRRCRRVLESNADLTKYGTRDAVADLDSVRAALGYDKIDLFGLSYGTTVALRYLATHPGRVRAAVLMGVSPASSTPPKNHALAGQRAIKLLFDECRQDAACNALFDPASDVERVRARLPSVKGAPSEEVFFEKLRSLMYQPSGARGIPFILSRAAAGDLTPFYEATRPSGPSLYADGMFLSVICSEGVALMDLAAASQAAKGTVFGDYRLRRQRQACAEWPRARVGADHLRPVRSNAPVLLISGELDPVTPPSLADEAARTLPNAKHLIIPSSGHIFDGMTGIDTCLNPLILSFLEAADASAVSGSCMSAMKPPGFVTSAPPLQPMRN
jgi:pimeloyl-ACP methyl ester carboxylesterase